MDVNGVPVAGSEHVADAALLEAALTLTKMSSQQPHLLTILREEGVHIGIIGKSERLTDLPAYNELALDDVTDWNQFRGLGATGYMPVNGCAEENLLCLPYDAYRDENICVHELAHTLSGSGKKLPTTRYVDFGEELGDVMDLDERIQMLQSEARRSNLWRNTYAATNYEELWAEGVQSYYSVNFPHSPPSGDSLHNDIWHRSALEEYHPELAAVIGKVHPSAAGFDCPSTSMEACDCGAIRQLCEAAGVRAQGSLVANTDEPSDRPTDGPTGTPTTKAPTPSPSRSPVTSTSVPTRLPITAAQTPAPNTDDPSDLPTDSPTTKASTSEQKEWWSASEVTSNPSSANMSVPQRLRFVGCATALYLGLCAML